MNNPIMLVIPGLVVAFGLLVLLVYVLCVALKGMADRLAKTNELLLLAWQGKEGNEFAKRALVAKAAGLASSAENKPKDTPKLKGVAEKAEKKAPMMTMGMGI